MNDGNGKQPELTERRKAAVEHGLTQYQQLADERDKLEAETRELRTQIAGYKVAAEADNSRILQLESRANSMVLERDQAIADLAVYQALFVSIKAQLRAFNVPNEPLIRDKSEESDRALDYLRTSASQQQAAQAQAQSNYSGAYPPVGGVHRETFLRERDLSKPEGGT